MATSAAVVYIRPLISAVEAPGKQSAATVFLPIREASGAWSSAGSTPASANLRNLKSWLPPTQVPLGYVDNDRDQPVYIDTASWYKFFDYAVNVVLGGINASTLADVTLSQQVASLQSAIAAQTVAVVAQQVQANAEALAATVQVTQAAALPGSENIPPVQQGVDSA